ncbi:pyridoxal phosphate-dependent transferase [Mucidula mucida]|nr:pyridoxal phosphate-dependent transferase [Mucidula mucida]
MSVALSNEFCLPTNSQVGAVRAERSACSEDAPCTYLCGNSLGLLSTRSRKLVQEELDVWSKRGVVGHFSHPYNRGWVSIADHATPLMAEIVGAQEKEVACMSTLTANLHLMMDSFYKPTAGRYKILCEAHAFPSDQYAFASQVRAHGLNPATAILEMSPRPGEYTLREQDILETLEREGSCIALVLFSGVQYYTGQYFPIESVTRKAKQVGCICGWDLAHAVGNVPLSLHDWAVDFAVWCTYKYLNSGPGGIGGLFVHEKWNETELPKFAGWWGTDPSSRFKMGSRFSPIQGAQGFQQSNPSALCIAALLGSLQIFKEVGMPVLRERSLLLTSDLEIRLRKSPYFVETCDVASVGQEGRSSGFTIITPRDSKERGCQLSLFFLPVGSGVMQKVFDSLVAQGVIGDERQPDVIRLAPIPLYNVIADTERAAACLNRAFEGI